MKIMKVVALAVVAVVVPGLLAASVFLISAHSFEAPASAVPRVRGNIASPNPQWSPGPRKKSAKPKKKGAGKKASGRCDEAEHAHNPGCTAGGGDDDSVPVPGDSSGSGSDNSGPGSDNSGSDNSGSDNSGSDNSGSGSDDSGSDNSGSDEDNSGSGSDDSDDLGSSDGDD